MDDHLPFQQRGVPVLDSSTSTTVRRRRSIPRAGITTRLWIRSIRSAPHSLQITGDLVVELIS